MKRALVTLAIVVSLSGHAATDAAQSPLPTPTQPQSPQPTTIPTDVLPTATATEVAPTITPIDVPPTATATEAPVLLPTATASATPEPPSSPLPTPTPRPTATPERTLARLYLPLVVQSARWTVYLPWAGTSSQARTAPPAPAERDAIAHYLDHVYDDGDYLNDWLTHVRPPVADALQALGQAITAASDRFTFTITFEGELADQAEFVRGWQYARREGMSPYQAMWIGVGEVLDNHLDEPAMRAVWLVIEEQCVN